MSLHVGSAPATRHIRLRATYAAGWASSRRGRTAWRRGALGPAHDAGRFWDNISDDFFATGSVGALAVSASDPNVVYAGMGESNIRGNVSHGDGVYRSEDGGRTWQHRGLRPTRHVAKSAFTPIP